MIGLLVWRAPVPKRRQRAVTVKEVSILHTRFLQVEILRGARTPETVLRRRVHAAGKQLRKQGIRQVVLPADECCREWLEKWEIRPVSTLPLRRALAADWVRWLLEKEGLAPASARVAIAAAQPTGEVVHTVTELVLRHRYVLLDLPYGGETLAGQLRKEYGVSLLLHPSKAQMEEAEVRVLFEPRNDLEAGGRTIALYEEDVAMPPLYVPPALEDLLPQGVDRPQLLSVLRQAGALKNGQITLESGTETPETGP